MTSTEQDVHTATTTVGLQRRPRENGRHFARRRFPARLAASTWPATEARRETVLAQLTSPPFTLESRNQKRRDAGLRLLLTWLEEQNGQTWQERWLATGADTAGFSWRQITERWLRERGELTRIRHQAMSAALSVAICADVIRPSITWFAAAGSARGLLAAMIEQCRDPEGFGQLRAIVTADPGTSSALATYALYRCASIVASKGGCLSDIVIGDLLELLDAEHNTHRRRSAGQSGLYRALHGMGIFGDDAPQTFRELRTIGQRTPEELIDRYGIVCQPIRDLLVDYLRERQPALDYNSLESLSQHLGRNFWANIEQLHPGIDTLHLPADVAQQWKQRLRTLPKTITTETGEKRSVVVPRINYRECLTPVRAFYLDLAHWAIENPARWSRWVVPCPVGAEEINRRKDKRQRKSRMDARTRERLPVLPLLVSTTQQRHKDAQALLEAATRARPGKPFSAAGQHLIRSIVAAPGQGKIWAHDPITGKRRNLALEEEHAFWTFAVVEVLRHTGIRVEELLEISHHSLVQYRLPTTGELVPLLQIAPSKTDTERLLVVSPELADILSTVISRIRTASGSVPLVPAFDRYEAIWMPPAPLLFQRRVNGEHRAINDHAVRQMLRHALADTGLVDSLTGQPLHYTPRDFRRVFLTDALLNGLPPHIAQVIAGHQDINVTIGYKAVYPEEAIQSHLAFLARRRAMRPTDEYRVPTDEEWQEFLGHFERRKVSTGTCARAFGTPCIHEHACVRCSMLWPDPAQRDRLAEIRDNLVDRIAEAEREGWLGEIEGLTISLKGAQEKLAQIDRRRQSGTVHLNMPTIRASEAPEDD